MHVWVTFFSKKDTYKLLNMCTDTLEQKWMVKVGVYVAFKNQGHIGTVF